MNRIILVGNGFDSAHNLKTSYNDFLDDYWVNLFTILKDSSKKEVSDGLCSFLIKYDGYYSWKNILSNAQYIKTIEDLFSFIDDRRRDLCFSTSPLFGKIKEASLKRDWNGIESEYYDFLIRVVLDPTSIRKYGIDISIDSINAELQIIQTKLVEYLTRIQRERINDSIINESIKECMLAPFCAKEISIESQKVWTNFISRRMNEEDIMDVIKWYRPLEFRERTIEVRKYKTSVQDQLDCMGIESIGDRMPSDMLYPDRVMLLNFNYTNTADMYMPDDEYIFPINHIHGDLSNPDSVIFGYGDELDEKYQEIRNLNNNELLKNMKSIRYLEDVNYRNLLTFIESAPYQVYIMGHSCGVSDRTLLNTLFEHPNCVSIKPFYYVNEQGQDNYIEIVQNISRNFNDPKKMRDRVVNKTYCLPLPQCPKIEKP